MKFQFTAIDESGKPLRGVLRADNEAEAIAALRSDNIFPKSVEETSEDTKVTWTSRTLVKQRHAATQPAAADNSQGSMVLSVPMRVISGPSPGKTLPITLLDSGHVTFGDPVTKEMVLLHRDDLETAEVAGFPRRVLRLVRLNGVMYEFHAGWFVCHSAVKRIARALREKD